MAKGYEISEWNRTVSVVAKIHNVNVVEKHSMITDLRQIHPFYAKDEIKKFQRDPSPEELAILQRTLESIH